MNINKDLIDNEIKQWEKFLNNYDRLADNMLVTALAFYKEDERKDKFKSAIELLKSLEKPLDGFQMFDSIKTDIDSYEKINNEAKIAIRTLTWIKENEQVKTEDILDEPVDK